MKKLIIVFSLILVISGIGMAQDSTKLVYGDSETGDYVEGFLKFVFDGAADDIVIVIFGAEDFESELGNPLISIQDSEGVELATAESFGTGELFTVLPTDGVYTVAVSADEPGRYALSLLKAEVIESGATVEGRISSEESHYYAIRAEDDFSLFYEKTDGQFYPQVSIAIQGSYGFDDVAVLAGNQVKGGSFSVEAGVNDVYLVVLTEALFDFNFTEVIADYTITIK